MNVFFTTRRSAAARLLVLAAIVVLLAGALLAGAQGTGQAATTSAPPKPKDVDAFAETVLKSTGTYWGRVLTQLGHPAWHSYYFIVKRDKVVRTPCGLAGDRDLYPSAEPAGYCRSNNTVYLSTQWLYNHTGNNGTTPYGFANIIAHEVGHAVQTELRLPNARVEPRELQADCFSAMWMRHTVDTGAATTKDALDARRSAQTMGDYESSSPQHHGTADERVRAWTIGYNSGFNACRALNR